MPVDYVVESQQGEGSQDPIREAFGDAIANAYKSNLAKIPKGELTLTRALGALHDAYASVPSDFVPRVGPTCGCFEHCRVEGDWLPD